MHPPPSKFHREGLGRDRRRPTAGPAAPPPKLETEHLFAASWQKPGLATRNSREVGGGSRRAPRRWKPFPSARASPAWCGA